MPKKRSKCRVRTERKLLVPVCLCRDVDNAMGPKSRKRSPSPQTSSRSLLPPLTLTGTLAVMASQAAPSRWSMDRNTPLQGANRDFRKPALRARSPPHTHTLVSTSTRLLRRAVKSRCHPAGSRSVHSPSHGLTRCGGLLIPPDTKDPARRCRPELLALTQQ